MQGEVKEYETWPLAYPGGIRVRTADGRTLEAEVLHQLGSPANPMLADQVRAKFRANAQLAGGSGEQLEAGVLALEDAADVRSAFRGLALEAATA